MFFKHSYNIVFKGVQFAGSICRSSRQIPIFAGPFGHCTAIKPEFLFEGDRPVALEHRDSYEILFRFVFLRERLQELDPPFDVFEDVRKHDNVEFPLRHGGGGLAADVFDIFGGEVFFCRGDVCLENVDGADADVFYAGCNVESKRAVAAADVEDSGSRFDIGDEEVVITDMAVFLLNSLTIDAEIHLDQ